MSFRVRTTTWRNCSPCSSKTCFDAACLAAPLSGARLFSALERAAGFAAFQVAHERFGIFSRVKTDAAVVFTTSYNEYAIKAFEYNCIDYLLKPVTDEGISRALEKFDRFHTPLSISVLQAAVAQMGSGTQSWRRRLLIGRGASIAVVPTENIACICIEFGYATVYLKDGSSGLLDMRLDELAAQLDPERFMKISRQCIVSLDSVTGILPLPENRLSLVLCTPDRKEVTVTRSHTAQLKSRLDR